MIVIEVILKMTTDALKLFKYWPIKWKQDVYKGDEKTLMVNITWLVDKRKWF